MAKAKSKVANKGSVGEGGIKTETIAIVVLTALLATSIAVQTTSPQQKAAQPPQTVTFAPLSENEVARLASSAASFEAISDKSYWLQISGPELHISQNTQGAGSPVKLPEDHLEKLQADIIEQGYLHLSANVLDWEVPLQTLADTVLRLEQLGWNPTWLLLFDEVWHVGHRLSQILTRTTRSQQIFDFYVFNIHRRDSIADTQGAGWNIHRDRDGDGDFGHTFHPDGVPKYSTVWVALTEANPINSCIYGLPASSDPYYFGSNNPNATSGQDPGLAVREAGWQEVRAMPAAQGDVYSWSHRLLHWGSSSSSRAKHNRIAMSFAVADDEFESGLLVRGQDALPLPTWEERLVLCAFQMIKYHHNLPVDHVKDILIGILSKHGKLLQATAWQDAAYASNFEVLYRGTHRAGGTA